MNKLKLPCAVSFAALLMTTSANAGSMLGPDAAVTKGADFSNHKNAPIILVQSSDAAFRVGQMEEQMRALNGRVEEMTFQLLQLQEQIRKMQEDNEFRFQELEDQSALKKKGKSKLAGKKDDSLGKQQPSDFTGNSQESDGNRDSITDLIEGDSFQKLGEPAGTLGTLTFDSEGNLIDSNVGNPLDLTQSLTPAPEGMPDNEVELFDLGYQYVQGGQYDRAIEVFRQYSLIYPDEVRSPEANFWLGESYFSLRQYEDAARVFLDNHKRFPRAKLAPQNLLKLGVSLAGLQQRELACATYAEVPKKYPAMPNSVRKRVGIEQRSAKCKNS